MKLRMKQQVLAFLGQEGFDTDDDPLALEVQSRSN
jgi:hypothetical protein